MLICPECQSGNPDTNKFCQHCGISLINTRCHNCGEEISFIALKCKHCGIDHAKNLLALIISESSIVPQLELVSNVATNNTENTLTSSLSTEEQSWKISQQYLDFQQRYYLESESNQELLATLPNTLGNGIIQTQVMDKFPLKESYLDTLRKKQKEIFTDLQQELSKAYLSVSQYWNSIGIPTIALPYLVLEQYTPVIPSIYDTWQNENLGVLLLSDRSSWELIRDFWSKEDVPWEQVLWSLNEMIKYWIPLSKTGCTATLLKEDNLRIDEDQSFGFQQLYLDSQDDAPQLADLALKWQEWLSKTPEKYPAELANILDKAIAKEITTVEHLTKELYTLVTSQQNDFDPVQDTIDLEEDATDWLQNQEDIFTFESPEIEKIDSLFYPNDSAELPTAILAMQIASVTEANCTDIGSQRDHNEDFFGSKTIITQEENPRKKTVRVRGLYVVCDGMGGHSAGEVASAMAVETLQSYFYTYWQDQLPEEQVIKDGILLANRTIYQTNVENERSGNGMMGTTLVMALLQDHHLAIAHVGDSRIYRITRTHGLEQLTQDHEVGQREINRGIEPEIAYGRPDAYQLTQALGPRDNKFIKPAIEFFTLQEDCLLLLCSDGLSDNNLIEKHWETYLQPLMSSTADLQSGLFKLIDFADRYNGHDNITGILLRIKLQPNFEP